MKRIVIKYWYVLPIFLAMLMLLLTVLITIQVPVLERIILILLLLTLIVLPISWIVLLFNKEWRKSIVSIATSTLVVCVLFFPLGIAILSHHVSYTSEQDLPIAEDSCLTEPVDSLNPITY